MTGRERERKREGVYYALENYNCSSSILECWKVFIILIRQNFLHYHSYLLIYNLSFHFHQWFFLYNFFVIFLFLWFLIFSFEVLVTLFTFGTCFFMDSYLTIVCNKFITIIIIQFLIVILYVILLVILW